MRRPLSVDEIQSRIKKVHGDKVTLDVDTYVNTNTKARFIDREYGEWWAKPDLVMRGSVCLSRRGKRQHKPLGEVKRRLNDVHRGLVQIDPQTYAGTHQKARFIDKEYGEWWANVKSVLSGRGNPTRGQKARANHHTQSPHQVAKRVREMYGDEVAMDLSSYSGIMGKCRFIDKEYGEWWSTPNDVLSGKRSSARRSGIMSELNTLPAETIQNRIRAVHGGIVTLDVSEYQNTRIKSKFVDRDFGPWIAAPHNVLQGHGHPDRSHRNSKPQKEIKSWMESLGVSVVESYKIPGSRQETDIFVPSLRLGIEYHGLYWHSEEHKDKPYHTQKRQLCEQNEIRLLQFFSDEVEFKLPIVQSIIQSHLRINQAAIYARKCEIRPVDNKRAQHFLKDNHLMGEYRSAKYIGLFLQDQLISLLGYKKNKDALEISRFCNLLNHNVSGGLSKLLRYIEKEESPQSIISWVDLRYGNGHSLEKIGFKKTKETLGWRWTDCKNTFNRLKCRANMDSRNLTQKQHAEELGWVKIYDAGQALFVKEMAGE